MDFSTKTLDAKNAVTAVKTGALVVGIYENRKLSKAAGALDKLGAISAALKSGDISGKPGSTLL
ncbi:M17 family peptidase N-terminal domain-containing protein, partial [Herbaspirillum frisingense]